jgi:hypothetical protein
MMKNVHWREEHIANMTLMEQLLAVRYSQDVRHNLQLGFKDFYVQSANMTTVRGQVALRIWLLRGRMQTRGDQDPGIFRATQPRDQQQIQHCVRELHQIVPTVTRSLSFFYYCFLSFIYVSFVTLLSFVLSIAEGGRNSNYGGHPQWKDMHSC